MIDGDAIEEVERLVKEAVEPFEIDGQHFVPCGMQQIVPQVFRADALQVRSLSGFIGYIEENRDGLKLDTLTAHVVTPTRVELIGVPESVRLTRPTYITAVADPKDICCGWQTPTEFIVMLTTCCEPGVGDIAAVIKLVGNIKREQSVETKDDGMAQSVEQRAGVTLVERADVPNPVSLSPYRSFLEVEQVMTPFLLRFDTYDSGVVTRLFECDGGSWENEARKIVAQYLRAQLPDDVVVIA